MTMTMPRLIECDGAFLRDLGGCRTADGSVIKLRTLFHAGGLHRIPESSIARLGCRTVLDVRRRVGVEPDDAVTMRTAFEVLASPTSVPALLHCSAGRDRTGVLAALLLAALGVDDEQIAARSPAFLTSPPQAIHRFFEGLRARHGGVRLYLADMGIYRETIESLRDNLLDVEVRQRVHTNP